MYRGDKMKYYTIHEMTEILGVTAQTLRNWDRAGKWKPHHTSPNDYRYYSEENLNQILNKPVKKQGKTIGYCRVSSPKKKSCWIILKIWQERKDSNTLLWGPKKMNFIKNVVIT